MFILDWWLVFVLIGKGSAIILILTHKSIICFQCLQANQATCPRWSPPGISDRVDWRLSAFVFHNFGTCCWVGHRYAINWSTPKRMGWTPVLLWLQLGRIGVPSRLALWHCVFLCEFVHNLSSSVHVMCGVCPQIWQYITTLLGADHDGTFGKSHFFPSNCNLGVNIWIRYISVGCDRLGAVTLSIRAQTTKYTTTAKRERSCGRSAHSCRWRRNRRPTMSSSFGFSYFLRVRVVQPCRLMCTNSCYFQM